MADSVAQNFENHAVHPRSWLLALLLILTGFVSACVGLFLLGRSAGPYLIGAGVLLNGAGSFVGVGLVRVYALKLQDRIIRAEMHHRLEKILPAEENGGLQGLTLKQLIGLRFASDGEMPALLRKVVNEGIQNPTEIKKMIRDWQGDYQRV
jgi:hypothetical protein